MPVFNRYCYEPLSFPESIRLILLDPAPSQDAPLRCSILQHRRRTTSAGYSAVSYTWGKRELTGTLKVRCGSDTSYLRVVSNLDALLRAFRAQDVPVCLWIDAICINQDDEMEKAQQIPLMGRIYSEAEQVRIWLGAADPTTAGTFAFFREASQLAIIPYTQPEVAENVVSLMMRKIKRYDGKSGVHILYGFFNRSWFSRRWVIQEAGLARKAVVHCGNYSIPLQTISLAAERIQSLDISWYQVKMVVKLPGLKANLDILGLLWYYHAACCDDPRDRVAAMFGLVPNIASQLQYNVHWSELYRQLAAFVLEFGCQDARLQLMLHLFEFGPVSSPVGASIPSWVPDWSKPRLRRLPYYSLIRNPDTYEPLPTSPGHGEKSILAFQNGGLHIQWDISTGGRRGRLVTFATQINSRPSSKEQRAEGVMDALCRLLPSPTGPAFDILAICALSETIMEFRHNTLDHHLDASFFRTYTQRIARTFFKTSDATCLGSLRGLDAILREFTVFTLEPFDSGFGATRVYGVGPRAIKSGDIMIPLWHLDWKPKTIWQALEYEGKALQLVTMLAVEPFRDGDFASNGQRLPPKGRIIGPSVCVVVGSAKNYTDHSSHGEGGVI